MNGNFLKFREKYPVFSYNGFEIEETAEEITLRFDFSTEGLCRFRPETKISKAGFAFVNSATDEAARRIVFSLGLVEAVSYWKATCSPRFVVKCGALSSEEKRWWKKLWFNGLGEFFFKNGIETDFDGFVEIENEGAPLPRGKAADKKTELCLVPVGGGKDSAVTLALLRELREKIKCFTVNDQPARTQTVLASGLEAEAVLKTRRTIDPELLALNARGFLNGHTPFSSIVAFSGLYCARLIGAGSIVLSNESSANEETVAGSGVNHQYSKSLEFENDFRAWCVDYIGTDICYFSLLRPFCELQIAKYFASLPAYRSVFRSCNAGSKKNIWCGKCAKCLFVSIILSPFLSAGELEKIFGKDMLGDLSLAEDFDGLTGVLPSKPFECVGTVQEVRAALGATAEKYQREGLPLPALLERYTASGGVVGEAEAKELLSLFDSRHNVPKEFIKYVGEMFEYVSGAN